MNGNPLSWRQKVLSAVVLLVVVAGGTRVAADLLAPLVPLLLVTAFLLGIYMFLLRRR